MNRIEKARYNQSRYEQLKQFEREHKDSAVVRRLVANRNAASRIRTAANVRLYRDEQSCIAKARKARGWTQKQLGELLGVSLQLVSHWENGRIKAPWAKLFGIMPELKEEMK